MVVMNSTIITFIFFFVVLIEVIVILIVSGMMQDAKLKGCIVFQRIIRALILIEFTLFNFLFSLIKAEYVYQLVLQILGNTLALVYFFLDFFYFSQRTRSYLLWMQEIVFDQVPLKKVFKVLDAKGIKYENKKKVPQQEFSIVDAGKGRNLCILIPSKSGGYLLKPIKQMDEHTLMFYAIKIEIDLDKEGSLKFYRGNLPDEAIKEYDYGSQSKMYLWIKNVLLSQKVKFILSISLSLIVAAIILVFAILAERGIFNLIDDWLSKPL